MYCSNCGNKVDEKADVCLKCGHIIKKNSNYNEDKPSIGLNIISLLWPFIGLILYLSMKGSTPIKAKKCGKYALIGFGIGIILVIIVLVIVFSSLSFSGMSDLNSFSEEVKDMAIKQYEEDNLNYSNCYNLDEIVTTSLYSGSVRVTKIKNGYNVKTYISKDHTYLVSEYKNDKRINFNIRTSTNPYVNFNCSE